MGFVAFGDRHRIVYRTFRCRLVVAMASGAAALAGMAGLVVVVCALAMFGAVLRELLQTDDPPPSAILLPAAAVAYPASTLLLRSVERTCGVAIHTRHCRRWTALGVFIAAAARVSTSAAVLLAFLVCLLCPASWLWLPIKKRPAAAAPRDPQAATSSASCKRSRGSGPSGAVEAMRDPLAAPPQRQPQAASELAATLPQRSQRYSTSFWGQAWTTNGAGRDSGRAVGTFEHHKATVAASPAAQSQFELDCVVDHAACRELLLQFGAANLEQRLQRSPYNRNQLPSYQSWLREAADAFAVPLTVLRDGESQTPRRTHSMEAVSSPDTPRQLPHRCFGA